MTSRRRRTVPNRLIGAAVNRAFWLKRELEKSPTFERFLYEAANRDGFELLDSHDVMLADGVRNRAYAEAIAACVNPGDVVLDLGTGTGVFACLAAKRSPRKVYAIDHSSVERARALALSNGLTGIEFERVHSRDFQPPEPIDVIIQEQLSAAIFAERVVENVVDLRDRALAPGGRILPNRLRLFVEPAQLRDESVIPLIWEHQVDGLDFGALRPGAEAEGDYPRTFNLHPDHFESLLSTSGPAVEVDLERDGPDSVPSSIAGTRSIERDGTCHGIVVYFDVGFGDVTSLTNRPGAPLTHWYPVFLRTPARSVGAGDSLSFRLDYGSIDRLTTWRWGIDG